jgi:hypothetical protein
VFFGLGVAAGGLMCGPNDARSIESLWNGEGGLWLVGRQGDALHVEKACWVLPLDP